MNLAYSREHVCHNQPMIWQPARRTWYCQTCKRIEENNEYRETPVQVVGQDLSRFDDQPAPLAS